MGGPSQDCSPLPAWGRETLLQLPRWASSPAGSRPSDSKASQAFCSFVFHSMSWVSARPLGDKIKQLFYTKCPSPVLGFASTPSALGHPWCQSSRSSGSFFTSTDQRVRLRPSPFPFAQRYKIKGQNSKLGSSCAGQCLGACTLADWVGGCLCGYVSITGPPHLCTACRGQ